MSGYDLDDTGGDMADCPRPLPVLLPPAPDEAFSSWVSRHAKFVGIGPTAMLRHCAPGVPSLSELDRQLRPARDMRLCRLFRIDQATLQNMRFTDLDSDVEHRLVAKQVDHQCARCARALRLAGFKGAAPRAWFHVWRITCSQCGARVEPPPTVRPTSKAAIPDLYSELWEEALEGQALIADAIRTGGPGMPVPPTRLLRLITMIIGDQPMAQRRADLLTLNAAIPGFNAVVDRYRFRFPMALIQLPLALRSALLAGYARAVADPERAIKAMWPMVCGHHRAHFRFLLTDFPNGHRLWPWISNH